MFGAAHQHTHSSRRSAPQVLKHWLRISLQNAAQIRSFTIYELKRRCIDSLVKLGAGENNRKSMELKLQKHPARICNDLASACLYVSLHACMHARIATLQQNVQSTLYR